jgi:hypothetical protein
VLFVDRSAILGNTGAAEGKQQGPANFHD